MTLQELFDSFPLTVEGVAREAQMHRSTLQKIKDGGYVSLNRLQQLENVFHDLGKALMQVRLNK